MQALRLSITEEIEIAQQAGVTHPENLPFLLTPKAPARQGVLLVHGFGSSPHEMRDLADFLVARQCTVLGTRLPGHGTTPEDLANMRAEDWLQAVERSYQILRQLNLSVSAVGLSTGTLLLILLSLKQPLERMVLLAPFLRLKHPLSRWAGPLSLITPYHSRQIEVQDRPFYYQKRPLKGVAQLNRLRKQVKKHLSQVTTPTLVLASEGDQTVYPETAKQLFDKLGSQVKNYHKYGPQVPHVLTTTENPCQLDVFQRTADFLTFPAR